MKEKKYRTVIEKIITISCQHALPHTTDRNTITALHKVNFALDDEKRKEKGKKKKEKHMV